MADSNAPMAEYLKVGGCNEHGTVTIGFHRDGECIAAGQMDLQTALDFMDSMTAAISEIMVANGADPKKLSEATRDREGA